LTFFEKKQRFSHRRLFISFPKGKSIVPPK
jgi:hypothetical protein